MLRTSPSPFALLPSFFALGPAFSSPVEKDEKILRNTLQGAFLFNAELKVKVGIDEM